MSKDKRDPKYDNFVTHSQQQTHAVRCTCKRYLDIRTDYRPALHDIVRTYLLLWWLTRFGLHVNYQKCCRYQTPRTYILLRLENALTAAHVVKNRK